MSAPAATPAQVRAVVARALRRDQNRSPGRPRVLIHADPASLPALGAGDDDLAVVGSASPLEIRRLVHDHAGSDGGDKALVVLTSCTTEELGHQLVARFAGNRVWSLDRWEAVKALFSVSEITRDLAGRSHLADALIEAQPVGGYPVPRSRVLDTDTALAALLRAYLQLSPDVDTLAGLLRWATDPGAAHRLGGATGLVAADLQAALVDRFGPGAEVVVGLLLTGHGDDLIAWCLAGGVVHHEAGGAGPEATVRLEVTTGVGKLTSAAWQAAGAAAETWLTDAPDATVVDQLVRAEACLQQVEGLAAAAVSDWLPAGFGQRLEGAALALTAWMADPADHGQELELMAAIDRVAAHRETRRSPGRVERLRMAARLVRRAGVAPDWGDRLATAAPRYRDDSAWVDRARLAVSRGESNAVLAACYADLTSSFDAVRARANESFAAVARTAASPQDDVAGIEAVLDDVVVPLAAGRPVALVVLDGMGWPTFLEVQEELARSGWTPWTVDGQLSRPVVAVLPTVTEYSRTSLFAGTVRHGDAASEQRAFRDHAGLRAVSKADRPPLLEHKVDLRVGGLDTVPASLTTAMEDAGQQVVAVVLNNIDERLKDVVAPPDGWTLAELDPLSWILDAARRAGRVVVLTADHGHVIDRDAVQLSGEGGERWRSPNPGPREGEIEVAGPRVVGEDGRPGGRIIVPWAEQLRYATRRNGYHGGITPQELLVPLAVLAVDDLEGWQPTSFPAPPWWHPRPAVVPDEPRPLPPVTSKEAEPPTLFDPPVDREADDTVTPAGGGWLDAVVSRLDELRTPQVRLSDDELRALLAALDAQGGQAITLTRLADITGLPAGRMSRYVGQLQQLVNIDGYGIVTVSGTEVRFDRDLLDRQLG